MKIYALSVQQKHNHLTDTFIHKFEEKFAK